MLSISTICLKKIVFDLKKKIENERDNPAFLQ
jgi:hypothetical protein